MKAIVTVVGKDQVGIIAAVCIKLADFNVNVLDISQTVMQGYFTMMMVVDISGCTAPLSQLCNPILLSDYSGNSATLAGAIVGAVCGFFGALISELNDQNEGIRWDKVMKCTASTALAGAAAGFVADVSIATFGAGTAIFIAAGAGALFSGLNSAYTQSTLKGSVDPQKVISDAIIGGLTNGLCTGTSSVLKPVVKGIKAGINYAFAQVCAELTPEFVNLGAFVFVDLVPTVITGAAGFLYGYAYDYISGD